MGRKEGVEKEKVAPEDRSQKDRNKDKRQAALSEEGKEVKPNKPIALYITTQGSLSVLQNYKSLAKRLIVIAIKHLSVH